MLIEVFLFCEVVVNWKTSTKIELEKKELNKFQVDAIQPIKTRLMRGASTAVPEGALGMLICEHLRSTIRT